MQRMSILCNKWFKKIADLLHSERKTTNVIKCYFHREMRKVYRYKVEMKYFDYIKRQVKNQTEYH